MAVKRTQLNK